MNAGRPVRPRLVPGVMLEQCPSARDGHGYESGLTVIELLLAVSVMATLGGIAVATTRDGIDELRTAMAARYLGARLMYARVDAVKRSASVALRFEPAADDYRYATYHDGNGNGVRTADIGANIDLPLTTFELLRDKFPGVRFELMPGVPDADGVTSPDRDGVRIGAARILTMSPDGTATAGTLYLHGRRSQYAVRVVGATGRVRVLQYRPGARTWVTR